MKVLIGYDNSPSARTALEELKQAGLPSDTDVLIITAEDLLMPSRDMGIIPAALTSTRISVTVDQLQYQAACTLRETHGQLEKSAAKIKSDFPGWRIATEVITGSAASAIIEKAADWRADLIIVGSQNHTVLERFFLGSVSQKVAIEADCSVRVARTSAATNRDNNAPRRLVAAVDSLSGESIIETITRRRWQPNTEVLILPVIENVAEVGDSGREKIENLNRLRQTATAILNAAGLNATFALEEKCTKDELLIAAEKWNADCIFIDSRNIWDTLDWFLIASISTEVITDAPCSVEIVRSDLNRIS